MFLSICGKQGELEGKRMFATGKDSGSAEICSVGDTCSCLSLEQDGLQNWHSSDHSDLCAYYYTLFILTLSCSTQTSFQVRSDLLMKQWLWLWAAAVAAPALVWAWKGVNHRVHLPTRLKRRRAEHHAMTVNRQKCVPALWGKEHTHVFVVFPHLNPYLNYCSPQLFDSHAGWVYVQLAQSHSIDHPSVHVRLIPASRLLPF